MQTLIKVCGCNTPEAVDAAVDAGADYIGLVHYAPSPRHVTLEQGAKLRARVPASTKVVLLLVNEQPIPTAQAVDTIKPDVVQFHGSETPEWLGLLRQHVPHELWKAVGLRGAETLTNTLRFRDAAHRVLYDSAQGTQPGGNGLTVDWSLLANFRHELPWGLAGGLTPENVAEAIGQVRPWGVDVSSGVETGGVKDGDKIRAFVAAARAAERQ